MFDSTLFGERLRKMRIAAGFSNQETLARAVGVSIQTISAYESGKRLPDAATLHAISEKLNCTVDYLLLREDGSTHDIAHMVEYTGLSEESLRYLNWLGENTLSHLPDFLNFALGESDIQYLAQICDHYLYGSINSMYFDKETENREITETDNAEAQLIEQATKLGYEVMEPAAAAFYYIDKAAERFKTLAYNYVENKVDMIYLQKCESEKEES